MLLKLLPSVLLLPIMGKKVCMDLIIERIGADCHFASEKHNISLKNKVSHSLERYVVRY